MRSPLSSIIASLVMEELEYEVITSLEYISDFYELCVDDILCIPIDKLHHSHFSSSELGLYLTTRNKRKLDILFRY